MRGGTQGVLGASAVALAVLLGSGNAAGHVHSDCVPDRGAPAFAFAAPGLAALRRRPSVAAAPAQQTRVRAEACSRRRARHSVASATAISALDTPSSEAGLAVDPFALTRQDMRRLKQKIKVVIDKKLGSGDKAHPLLKSSSREFFERSEKTWRPMVALLLSKAFAGETEDGADPEHHDDAMVIAEIIEIMHTSTVIHDTVLEDYEAFEKGNMAHRIYSSSIAGNKVSILAGDFLLSRASVLLSTLRNTDVVEIMAGALEAIMKGQMQLHRPVDNAPVGMDAYVTNLETRSGNLLASGCLCAALVAGYDRDSAVAEAAFAYGMNLGVAYQIVKDLQITERNYEKLFNKMQQAVPPAPAAGGGSDDTEHGAQVEFDPHELNEPLQRAGALMYAVDQHAELVSAARHGFKDIEELLWARELIITSGALDGVRARAAHHRDEAVAALQVLPPSPARAALEQLAGHVVEVNQNRMKRLNYDSEGRYSEPAEDAPKTGTQLKEVLIDAKKGAKMGMFSVREKLSGIKSDIKAQVQLAKDKLGGQ